MAEIAHPIAEPVNLVAKILEELERVTAMRERWRRYADEWAPFGRAYANLGPGIVLMTLAIEEAKAAIAGDDVIASLKALRSLEGFSHD